MKHNLLQTFIFSLLILSGCLTEENELLKLVDESDCVSVNELTPQERYTFAESYFSQDTSTCISRIINTVEGDPVYQYLVIQKDKAFLISDAREDKFYGEGEKVTKTGIIDIRIGYWDLDKNEFYPEESPISSEQNLLENVIVYSFKEGEYHPFN